MQGRIRTGITALVALAAAAALAVGPAGTSQAAGGAKAKTTSAPTVASLRAYGINDTGTLMATFLTDQPEELNWVRRISGLVNDTFVIGIDFRVQDGKFYAVGNHGGIYTITLPTGSSPVVVTKVSQLTTTLKGTTFGVDFNPAADRLRVISDIGQNLRHNLNDNTTAIDTGLSNGPASPASGVTAAAYTNNDLNADTATTLFDINTSTAQVVIQSPANNGTLAPTGALGRPVALNAGFDIYSDLSGGKTVSNTAFAALVDPSTGEATLNTVDVLTGAATQVGMYPFPLTITDVAVALDTN